MVEKIINKLRSLKRRIFKPSQKIIVGAGGTSYPEWLSMEIDTLNLLKESDWKSLRRHFHISAILAEHVWEHLIPEDALQSAKNCFKFLKRKGYLRVAVPDGFHPDPAYIRHVEVGGTGAGADDHKVLYNYKTFSEVFVKAGFKVRLLEYYDESGVFHQNDWDSQQGMIIRSRKYGKPRPDELKYTSIILDCLK